MKSEPFVPNWVTPQYSEWITKKTDGHKRNEFLLEIQKMEHFMVPLKAEVELNGCLNFFFC